MASPGLELLNQLGLRHTACPDCRQKPLRVAEVPESERLWCFCPRCHWQGPIVELAAAVWKTDLPLVVERLRTLSDEQIVVTKERLTDLAKLSRSWSAWRVCLSADATKQVTDGLQSEFLPDLTVRRQRYDLLSAILTSKQIKTLQLSNRIVIRIPKGTSESLLLIPHFDRFGRLCGFLACSPTGEQQFLPVIFENPEAGCGLSPGGNQTNHLEIHTTCFVFYDGREALQRSLHWNAFHNRSLSLRTACVGDYTTSVEALGDQPRLVCGSHDNPEHLQLAAALRASIGQTDPTIVSTDSYLMYALRHRQHWGAALSQLAPTWTDSYAAGQIARLPADAASRSDLYRQLSSRGDTRLQRMLADSPTSVVLQELPILVRETEQGWRTSNHGGFICSHNVRVESITLVDNAAYYRGTAANNDGRHTFTVDAATVDRLGFLPAVRDRLRLLSPPVELVFNASWSKRSWLLATQLSPPIQSKRCSGQVGWDPHTNRVQLAQFAIAHGRCLDEPLPYSTDSTPTHAIRRPVCHNYEAWQGQIDKPGLWALLALLVHNILAEACGWAPRGLAILSDSHEHWQTLLTAVGAVITPNTKLGDYKAGWPTLSTEQLHNKLLLSPTLSRACFAADNVEAAVAGLYGCHRVCLLANNLPAANFAATLLSYLEDLSERRYSFGKPSDEPLHAVLTDLSNWSLRRLGRGFPIQTPARLILSPRGERRDEALLELLGALWQSPPGEQYQGRVVNGEIEFSVTELREVLQRCRSIAIPLALLRTAFSQCRSDLAVRKSVNVWAFPAAKWFEDLRRRDRQTAARVKSQFLGE